MNYLEALMDPKRLLQKLKSKIHDHSITDILRLPSEASSGAAWEEEKLYIRADDYYADILKAVQQAQKSIDFETYIFEPGFLGNQLITAFLEAAKRGVRIRLMVDGVGSPLFADHYGATLEKPKIQYRVYRPWHWVFPSFSHAFQKGLLKSATKTFYLFSFGMNRRDHRKLCVIDGETVWIGSFNVSDALLEAVAGEKAWRDTGVRLSCVATPIFSLAFQAAWEAWKHSHLKRLYRRLLVQWISHQVMESPIRVNLTRRLRKLFYAELLEKIKSANQKIWITTPYFIPPRSLVKHLVVAARRGCDVQLILPAISDVPMVLWASKAFYSKLLKSGCHIYEFSPRVLHAKTLIADSWVVVGSSNMNHRSLLHDMEVNVILQKKESLETLVKDFQADRLQSREVTLTDLRNRSYLNRFLSWLFFHFRYWF